VCTQYGGGLLLNFTICTSEGPMQGSLVFSNKQKTNPGDKSSSQKTESPASLPVCKSSTNSGMTSLSHVRLAAPKLRQTSKIFLCGLVLWCGSFWNMLHKWIHQIHIHIYIYIVWFWAQCCTNIHSRDVTKFHFSPAQISSDGPPLVPPREWWIGSN
jgi:hypothetical protein